jgi:tetratricopeptide (TPR) repeat protein
VLTLIPVLGLVQVGGQAMADRYTYLPGLGPFLILGLMVAWGAEKMYRRTPAIKYSGAAAGIFLLAAISLLTWKQIRVWENSLTLWTYVIEKEPARISIAYNNRALAFFTKGDIESAIEDYHRAIAQDPGYAEAHSNLGVALSKKGLVDEAIREFQIAVRLSPRLANAHRNLAPALYKSGRIAEALEQYVIVAELLPADAGAHADLGSAYGTMGSYDKAIEHFQIALRLQPDLADTHYNLGIAYQAKGLMDQAVAHLEAAARLNPSDASIRDALAEVHGQKNSPAKP